MSGRGAPGRPARSAPGRPARPARARSAHRRSFAACFIQIVGAVTKHRCRAPPRRAGRLADGFTSNNTRHIKYGRGQVRGSVSEHLLARSKLAQGAKGDRVNDLGIPDRVSGARALPYSCRMRLGVRSSCQTTFAFPRPRPRHVSRSSSATHARRGVTRTSSSHSPVSDLKSCPLGQGRAKGNTLGRLKQLSLEVSQIV